jgi:hypothetical protein
VVAIPLIVYAVPSLTDLKQLGLTAAQAFDVEAERLRLQNDARSSVLQALAGLVVAVGAYGAWKQLRTSHEAQISDRFTRAVDQLGRRDDAPDVAVGGAFALERIARDSANDRKPISDVLSAYVRRHSSRPVQESEPERLDVRAPDIQAAMTVLASGMFDDTRLVELFDIRLINLEGVQLRGANLDRAKLRGAWLPSVGLQSANLLRADFSQALMQSADMHGALANLANFRGVMLNGADCREGSFYEVDFRDAILEEVDFRGVNLSYSNFKDAYLGEAKLNTAILEHAKLQGAVLEGATADELTKWPEGFDPVAAGVIIR